MELSLKPLSRALYLSAEELKVSFPSKLHEDEEDYRWRYISEFSPWLTAIPHFARYYFKNGDDCFIVLCLDKMIDTITTAEVDSFIKDIPWKSFMDLLTASKDISKVMMCRILDIKYETITREISNEIVETLGNQKFYRVAPMILSLCIQRGNGIIYSYFLNHLLFVDTVHLIALGTIRSTSQKEIYYLNAFLSHYLVQGISYKKVLKVVVEKCEFEQGDIPYITTFLKVISSKEKLTIEKLFYRYIDTLDIRTTNRKLFYQALYNAGMKYSTFVEFNERADIEALGEWISGQEEV